MVSPSALPLYSPAATSSERVVTIESNPQNTSVLPQDYVYDSNYFKLDLGPSFHDTPIPSFGRNATILGSVEVKRFDHVVRIEVTLRGYIVTVLMDRGLPSSSSTRTFLSITSILYNTSVVTAGAPATRYPFSISIPTYVPNEIFRLPPSHASLHGIASGDVKYVLRVDVVRKGWRRHESLKIPILYLPKSTPPPPIYLAPDSNAPIVDQEAWEVIDVPAICTGGNTPPFGLQLALPLPLVYTASHPIPFIVTLQAVAMSCRSSAFSMSLAAQNTTVQLIKSASIWVNGYRSTKERVIGSAKVAQIDDQGPHKIDIRGCVEGCNVASEMSWKFDEYLDIKFLIQVVVKPPSCSPSLSKAFPTFTHRQLVYLTTHSSHEDPHADFPALELLTPETKEILYQRLTRNGVLPRGGASV